MNQTKKRLKIIKLAIAITDIETIHLQILKLGLLKTDQKIKEIITALQSQNYAQAQALIDTYIETPIDEIIQRTPQEKEQILRKTEYDIIEEFDLFMAPTESNDETDFDSFLYQEAKSTKKNEYADFNDFLHINPEDVLAGNNKLDLSCAKKDDFFETQNNTPKAPTEPNDDFFDAFKSTTSNASQTNIQESNEKGYSQEQTVLAQEKKTAHAPYKPIPYIEQKLQNIYAQFPPKEEMPEDFSFVSHWLQQISTEGYSQEDIEAMFATINEQRHTNQSHAVLLLLLAGATESKFAQFMLARELYKGELLKKNIPEAVAHIYRLAMDDYPEALCDLAQFYEHGIGKEKNKEQALSLYKEAMDCGVQRAGAHYERLKKKNKRLFGMFKNRDEIIAL